LPKSLNQRDLFEPGTHLAAVGPNAPPQGATMKSILDNSFRYTKSIDTDLRKTFARIRREQRQQARVQVEGDSPANVFPIKQLKNAAGS